jgi:hypothetical protein
VCIFPGDTLQVNADFSDVKTVAEILAAWPSTEQAAVNDILIAKVNGKNGEKSICDGSFIPTTHYATPAFHEFVVLARRGFLSMLRNPLVIWLRMALYGLPNLTVVAP